MVSERRSGDKEIGGDGSGGEQEPDGLDDEDAVLFDVAELSTDETDWLAGPDYTRAIREAKRGERAVWRMLRGVSHRGSWARTKAWSTRDGEPVTRVDLHPDGWLELEARMRDLEERAADGDRYRLLMAQRDGQQEGDAGKDSGRSWRKRHSRSLEDVLVTWGGSLVH
jgi:hypothetical protein